MPIGFEVEMYRNIGRIADALEDIAQSLDRINERQGRTHPDGRDVREHVRQGADERQGREAPKK